MWHEMNSCDVKRTYIILRDTATIENNQKVLCKLVHKAISNESQLKLTGEVQQGLYEKCFYRKRKHRMR